MELLKKNNYPKNYDTYIPTYYDDVIKLTETNIKEVKNKLITTKNIYNTIVNSLTKNYLLANEARWNFINNNKALNWKQIWQNTFKAYNIPYEKTYTINCYIGYYMLTKKHMITPKAKIIYHQCVINVVNTMKQLIMIFTTVRIEKIYGTPLNL